jgi:hypothetical protein
LGLFTRHLFFIKVILVYGRHLLENNLDNFDWGFLSLNCNAIDLLENNFDKIVWSSLSQNPYAIHLVKTI